MVKNLPEWLKKNYNTLWDKYQKNEFTLEDTSFSLNASINMTSKTLWQLENKGFIYKTRSKIDYRNKIYRLIPPEDVKYIIGLYSLTEKDKYKKFTIMDKLVFINDELQYALTGSQAAYYYHEYINPPKLYEIKIDPNDEGKWIAFLTDGHTRVYIDEVIQTKSVRVYIKLKHSLYNIENLKIKTNDGIYIEKIEYLLIDLLNKETETSIKEIIAIIIRNQNVINWFGKQGLIKLALESNNMQRLGFLLDVINYESKSEIVNKEIIKSIENYKNDFHSLVYPKGSILFDRYKELQNLLSHDSLISEKELQKYSKNIQRYEEYSELGREWGVIPIIPRNTIQKVLTDMRVLV